MSVNAVHGVHDFLDGPRDVVLDGFGRRARIQHLDEDDRELDVRHALDAQAVVREHAQDQQRHITIVAKTGWLMLVLVIHMARPSLSSLPRRGRRFRRLDGRRVRRPSGPWPARSRRSRLPPGPATTSISPCCGSAIPSFTGRRAILPSSMVYTNVCPASSRTALAGITVEAARAVDQHVALGEHAALQRAVAVVHGDVDRDRARVLLGLRIDAVDVALELAGRRSRRRGSARAAPP